MKKKYLAMAAAAGLVLGGAGIAAAYFTASGSGTGAANVGTTATLKIHQVGAGYESIVPAKTATDPYVEDQCLTSCSADELKELGDQVTLKNPTAYQQLVSINIALRNYTSVSVTMPVTVSFLSGISGPFTVTKTVTVVPAVTPHLLPSLTVVTLTVAKTGLFITRTFTYGISYPEHTVAIALTSSEYDQTVGSSVTGALWVKAPARFFPFDDFPACTGTHSGTLSYPNTHFKATTFSEVTTKCGPAAEAYAYGTTTELATTGNGNIPAVNFNVVGGVVGPLYPGAPSQPVDYAVSNFGPSPVHIGNVAMALATTPLLPTGCSASWFAVTTSPQTFTGRTFPSGTTVVTTSSVPKISLTTEPTTQTACKNATVPLKFTASA